MELNIYWIDETRTAVIYDDERRFKFAIDNPYFLTIYYEDGVEVSRQSLPLAGDLQGNPVMPVLIDARTFLPIRTIGEVLGFDVDWYDEWNLVRFTRQMPTVAARALPQAARIDAITIYTGDVPWRGGV
ncbi:MAG: copper amine oxidase N-terminal domain-containing protein [Defluviitaleaceae bacterium]|nr:copper amine oxidase N-terminal domain-containing protein [Defluviitaleaceae bacterium]